MKSFLKEFFSLFFHKSQEIKLNILRRTNKNRKNEIYEPCIYEISTNPTNFLSSPIQCWDKFSS